MSPEEGEESVEEDLKFSLGEVSMRRRRPPLPPDADPVEMEEDDEEEEERAADERATTMGMVAALSEGDLAVGCRSSTSGTLKTTASASGFRFFFGGEDEDMWDAEGGRRKADPTEDLTF